VNPVRSLTAAVLLGVWRLRSDLAFGAAVFGVVGLTAFVFAAAPRALNARADEGLRFSVAQANPYERNVEVDQVGRIAPAAGSDPLASVRAAGERYEGRFAPSVREVVAGRRDAVQTVRFLVVNAPGVPGPAGTTRYMTMRFLSDATHHVRLTAGRFPRAGASDAAIPFRGEQHTGPAVEVALSAPAAQLMSLGVGDLVFLAPDTQDTLVRDVPLSEHRFLAARVTGIFDARSGDAEWLYESRLGRPEIRDTEFARLVFSYAFFAGDAYADVSAAMRPFPLRYEWRYDIDASHFDAAGFDRFAADVRRLDAEFGETTYGQTVGVGVRTGLSAVLESFRRDRDAAGAAVAVAATGLFAVALAVVGLLALLAVHRTADAVALVRSRGGSTVQVLGAEWVQGLAIAAPAGAIGYGAALLTGGRPSALSVWLVVGIVLGAACVLALAALGPARRPPALRVREEAAPVAVSPRRAALEGLIVVLALVGVYLLRRRGLANEGGFDVYLAAVPLLLGLAAGILAVRLYPFPARALAVGAGRRADLVPALAFRRASRQATVTAAPVLVVLLAVSVAVFADAMAASLARAQSGAGELSPLALGTVTAFRLAVGLGAAYAALALVLSPLLTSAARLRDAAYLRALGLSRREVLSLTAVELVPPLAASLVFGVAVGVAITFAVEPGLDLVPLAGGRDVHLRFDPLVPLVLVIVLAAVLAASLAALGAAERRSSPSRALRMGER
jgi:putative ABC transport system permease protein